MKSFVNLVLDFPVPVFHIPRFKMGFLELLRKAFCFCRMIAECSTKANVTGTNKKLYGFKNIWSKQKEFEKKLSFKLSPTIINF